MNIFAKSCATLMILVSSVGASAQIGNVYKALAARCRIADSRVISSPIPAGATRNLDVTESTTVYYSTQGGSGSSASCGIPGTAQALAVSLTILAAAGTAGFFKIFPYLGVWQDGNTVNFNGAGVTNDVIVRQDTGPSAAELGIYSSAQTDYVVDVVGYFEPAEPTLTCTTSAEQVDSVAAGATRNTVAPSCPSGNVMTGTNCESSTLANALCLLFGWNLFSSEQLVQHGPVEGLQKMLQGAVTRC